MYTRTWAQMIGRARPGSAIGRVSEVIVHTEAGADLPASASIAQEVHRLRNIDSFHRTVRGWQGFGYSVMVCQSGRVYEGRGLFRSGAHTAGRNTTALAIMVPGHGDRTAMSDAAIAAARAWIAYAIRQGAVISSPKISGHRDYAPKSCPGNRIYPQLGRLRGSTPPPPPPPTPPPPPSIPDPVHQEVGMLQHGDKGPAVAILQRCLLGWRAGLNLDVNGSFNTPTRTFVGDYQERAGLTRTGKADPLTFALLLRFEGRYRP